MFALIISKQNQKLAKSEIQHLLNPKIIKEEKELIIIETKEKEKIKRLALTKKAYEIKEPEKITTYKIENIYGKITKQQIKEKAIEIKSKHPKSEVKLKNPETIIGITNELTGIKIFEREKLQERRADKRPAGQKAGINPKLARLMINLANPKKEVYDPFSGTGGILIEAGLMGLKVKGTEISKETTKQCEENLKYYGINKYELKSEDALTTSMTSKYVVTDPPYGRSTKETQPLCELINELLKKHKPKRAVITIPKGTPKKIPEEYKVIEEHSIYVHKSLTRELLIINRQA